MTMTKIVLLFWAMVPGDITEVTIIDGWRSMEECETAAESLTASNPVNIPDMAFNVVAMCQVVPR